MNTENLIESFVEELTAGRDKTCTHITTGIVRSITGSDMAVTLAGDTYTNRTLVRKVANLSLAGDDKCLIIYEGNRYYAIAKL